MFAVVSCLLAMFGYQYEPSSNSFNLGDDPTKQISFKNLHRNLLSVNEKSFAPQNLMG